MELVEFLRARYDDDERAATTLDELAGWERNGIESTAGGQVLDFLDRFSPARVLAEVNAKRRIVDGAEENAGRDKGWFELDSDGVLRLLALPYAGHPDYDPAWRPE